MIFDRLHKTCLVILITSACICSAFAQESSLNLEEIAAVRAKAHQDRFKKYILKKLEVYSLNKKKKGLCLDFVGKSDGLYESMFNGGPLMVDLANCGEEGDFIDGRIKAVQILDPREQRRGLSEEQVEQVITEINELFADKIYDPEIQP